MAVSCEVRIPTCRDSARLMFVIKILILPWLQQAPGAVDKNQKPFETVSQLVCSACTRLKPCVNDKCYFDISSSASTGT
jgi:hypothetical protein